MPKPQKSVSETTIVGVISDTHGLMRPQALDALRGSHLIIHAGDIGSSAVLDALTAIAPVVAVRGNVDGEWAKHIPETAAVEVGQQIIYVLHDIGRLDLKPEVSGFAVVVYGHSHKPVQELRDKVLYFNPGSAGPRRFKLPISLGRLKVNSERTTGELITIPG